MVAINYREVVQEVLLFRLETLVLLAAIAKSMEEFHVGFLCKVMGPMAEVGWDV